MPPSEDSEEEEMPKLKTNRSARKRFRLTGSGRKVRRYRACASHLLRKKTSKRKRRLRQPAIIDTTNVKAIRRLIPYG